MPSEIMAIRRILVTGANKGIGLAIATAILAQREDTYVLLGSRDTARGNTAVRELLQSHPSWGGRLEVVPLDVSSNSSVEDAASAVRKSYPDEAHPLYGLVNNAGVGSGESLADVLAVNTFGMWRVTEAFLPSLQPVGGRIVNVTSASGPSFVATCSEDKRRLLTDPDVDWSALEELMADCIAADGDPSQLSALGLGDGEPYGLSKALANAYTLYCARCHPSLHVNACTPGFIETDLTRRYAASRGKSPAELGMKPPEAGARAPMFLLFGELEGNGRYYGSDAQRSPLDRYRSPGSPPFRGD